MTDSQPRILVVDDEQTQLETVCRGLFLYGYACQGALSADRALEILDDGGASFDLVLTDLTMPGGSGLELVAKLRADRPGLPIIVVTGLAASEEVEAVRALRIPVLKKPFAPDSLDAAIRAALEPSGA